MNLATSEIVMVSLIPSLELLSFYILLLQEPTSLKIFSLLSRNQMNLATSEIVFVFLIPSLTF